MPKYRRYFELGKFYFLTLVTRARAKVFSGSQTINQFKDSLTRCSLRYPHRLYAWVFIPDHIHVILEHRDEHTPADLIRCVKRGFLYQIRLGDVGFGESDLHAMWSLLKLYDTVWQPRYYDHVIRDEEDFVGHVDYIHFNPVKHGYAMSPFLWDHSSIHKYQYAENRGGIEPPTISGMELE